MAIVEDDAGMRKSLERLLGASGFSTIAFESGEAFLQSTLARAATGLVLDIHLGGMSGIELRRRLATAGRAMPVVFITAFDDDATRAEAVAAGCVDYLLKPFDGSRLIAALERGQRAQRGN